MKFLSILTIILLTTSSVAMAKAERMYAEQCLPRVPAIEFEQAILIAIENHASSEQSFIDQVTLECENKIASWKVGFRLKDYESGHFIVTVFMDGSVKTTVVKDG